MRLTSLTNLAHTLAPRWSALCVALALAACGGGGSDTAPAAGGSAIGSAGTVAGSGSPSGTATCGLADFQNELLQRVNAARAAGANCGTHGAFAATGALQWNTLLVNAATGHSQDMSAQNYFSHTSLDGRTYDQRVTNAGYTWMRVAENIAAGYPSVQAVVDGWLASDGHCANLMDPNLMHVGVACVPGTATSTYATYWTMDLGTPR
jgi:uncharacterized protein YkwD